MMVPAADIGERNLNPEVSFEQLRKLAQAIPEASARIVRARSRRIFRGIGALEHLYSIEGLMASAMEDGIHRMLVHRFKAARHRSGCGISAAYAKFIDVVD